MKFVKIIVDGQIYNLVQSEEGVWTVTNRAPLSEGDYVMSIIVTTESGQEIVIDTTDEDLLRAVTLLVRDGETESGNRMFNYYPYIIKKILEFKALTRVEGFEVDFLKSEIDVIVNNAWLLKMEESRIIEWEKMLNLTPKDDETLDDRREKIIALICSKGKLNTQLINIIVGTFTNGGTATSYFQDSTIYVKINPPVGDKTYKFTNLEEALRVMIPSHLGLVVTRNYATWNDIKNNFVNWNTVSTLDNWQAVQLYVAPQ